MRDAHAAEVANLTDRIAQLELSHDGTLVWKISDFSRRLADARSGQTPEFYSQPFYTSRFGYKMCACVYLNGDGVGRGTHVSVYVAMMKGEFDGILPWPFRQKVTITLCAQSSTVSDYTISFYPDPQSPTYQRPTSELTPATGVPQFKSLDTLRTSTCFVVSDTIFLRISVNTP